MCVLRRARTKQELRHNCGLDDLCPTQHIHSKAVQLTVNPLLLFLANMADEPNQIGGGGGGFVYCRKKAGNKTVVMALRACKMFDPLKTNDWWLNRQPFTLSLSDIGHNKHVLRVYIYICCRLCVQNWVWPMTEWKCIRLRAKHLSYVVVIIAVSFVTFFFFGL